MEPAWILVGRQLRLAVLHKLTFDPIGIRTVLVDDDPGFRPDEPISVGSTDDCSLNHARMLGKQGLDLEWRAPSAADLEHVVATPAIYVVAAGILGEDVSRFDPTTARRSSLVPRMLRPAVGDRCAANVELAGLTGSRRPPRMVQNSRLVPRNHSTTGARRRVLAAIRYENVKRLG